MALGKRARARRRVWDGVAWKTRHVGRHSAPKDGRHRRPGDGPRVLWWPSPPPPGPVRPLWTVLEGPSSWKVVCRTLRRSFRRTLGFLRRTLGPKRLANRPTGASRAVSGAVDGLSTDCRGPAQVPDRLWNRHRVLLTGTLSQASCHGDFWTRASCLRVLLTGTLSQGSCQRNLAIGTLSRGPCHGILPRGPNHGDLATETLPRGSCRRDLVTETSSQGPCRRVLVAGTLPYGPCHRDLVTGMCHGDLAMGILSQGPRHRVLGTGCSSQELCRTVLWETRNGRRGGPYFTCFLGP
ncbi:hypothetical protein M885DRAFT_34738 [Pelagophyceae sp. CCMP2097]|nr:hypothetical protein M885DRAFT_34738 [Pelagophyceae sp. CCMP2097]